MDRLPFLPENSEDHNVLPILTQEFQEVLRKEQYPFNVAQNYKKYNVDGEFYESKRSGLATIKILEQSETITNDITEVEKEIISKHALAILQKEANEEILEQLRLKRISVFQKLSKHALETYELIQTGDLYPNVIEQYLDFTYNPKLHTCSPCKADRPYQLGVPRSVVKPIKKKEKISSAPPFQLEPAKISFHNYELSVTYKEKFKLRNISRSPQNFQYLDFPKESHFSVLMLTQTNRLAPGMCAEFLLIFHPTIFIDRSEFVQFRTPSGVKVSLKVSNTRDNPKLMCYVVDYNRPCIPPIGPGNKQFSEKRRSAVNFSIDCGSCLVGNFSLVTVYMKNEGEKGKFLIATENEWMYHQLQGYSTRAVELTQGCFTIFPALFELEKDEIGQLLILFVPEEAGLHTEKLYIICDNNSHQEVELLGDCLIFSNDFLKLYLMENTFTYARRKISLVTTPHTTTPFIFSVINKSPIHFSHYWALKTRVEENPNNKKMGADWIQIFHGNETLSSFSVTNTVVQLIAQTEEPGHYYIYLSLYLKNIPVNYQSAEFFVIANDDFVETRRQSQVTAFPIFEEVTRNQNISKQFKLADIHIFELGIFCEVKISEEVPERVISYTGLEESCSSEEIQLLKLSRAVLNFGVLPKNVKTAKKFYVENLTETEIQWRIVEVFCKDSNYYMPESSHLDISQGCLPRKGKIKVTYNIETKQVARWVSILILFSITPCICGDCIIESVCLVVCEVSNPKIAFQTESSFGVLTPKEFLYIGIPSIHSVFVQNAGILPGCFYFFKPEGADTQKLRVRLHPQSGVVPPGGTVEVKVELLALENGIFEDIRIPCFIGDCDKFAFVRIMCAVADINVHFYLPHCGGGYLKILWPPKVDMPSWIEETGLGENSFALNWGESGLVVSEKSLCPKDTVLLTLISDDSIAATYPTVKISNVVVKKPSKFTFYIENVTPIHGNFTVSATNYGPATKCFNHVLVKAKTRKPEYFWELSCLEGYGIAVEPHQQHGDMVPYEVVQIEIWIYANTWGNYLEEMIVEINELTPFCFNLIVQVTGLPIEFPFARNTTLPLPTLRFENVSYTAEQVTKNFTVTNISSVPIQLSWHVFNPVNKHADFGAPLNFLLEFNPDDELPTIVLAKKFYGCEACARCVSIEPQFMVLEEQSTKTVSVTIFTSGFIPKADKVRLKYKLIAIVGLKDCHKYKESYFKRKSGIDFNNPKLEIQATLELPTLKLDLLLDETIFDVFVNDILLTNYKFPEVYLTLSNFDHSPIEFSINIEKPFFIVDARTVPTGIFDQSNLVLQRQETLQIMLTFSFSREDLLRYADCIYEFDEKEGIVKTNTLVSTICKRLEIQQKGIPRQMIPFQINLHYPQIEVKPDSLKFDNCLLYHSKKTILSIYNLTASPLQFEIYKTTKTEHIEVFPSYGQIPRSTGANKQFIDIAVYFTPKHCKTYLDELRIFTNIPQYYIDVPISGRGSNDEKFYVD